MESYVIILNGTAKSGKTTFASLCKKNFYCTYNISTITPIKQALTCMFVDIDNKDDRTRKLMSDLKDMMTEFNQCSKIFVQKEIAKLNKLGMVYILFVDSREPEEIQWFKDNLKCKTLLVKNKRVLILTTNHADKNIENFEYDFVINNDEGLEELEIKAKLFVEKLLENGKLKQI